MLEKLMYVVWCLWNDSDIDTAEVEYEAFLSNQDVWHQSCVKYIRDEAQQIQEFLQS